MMVIALWEVSARSCDVTVFLDTCKEREVGSFTADQSNYLHYGQLKIQKSAVLSNRIDIVTITAMDCTWVDKTTSELG